LILYGAGDEIKNDWAC
jgi:hypothetical protein